MGGLGFGTDLGCCPVSPIKSSYTSVQVGWPLSSLLSGQSSRFERRYARTLSSAQATRCCLTTHYWPWQGRARRLWAVPRQPLVGPANGALRGPGLARQCQRSTVIARPCTSKAPRSIAIPVLRYSPQPVSLPPLECCRKACETEPGRELSYRERNCSAIADRRDQRRRGDDTDAHGGIVASSAARLAWSGAMPMIVGPEQNGVAQPACQVRNSRARGGSRHIIGIFDELATSLARSFDGPSATISPSSAQWPRSALITMVR